MNLERLDWRIWLGMSLTFGWLVLGYGYISKSIGWGAFTSLPAATLGSFLEGAFAPLAFLWLVIGYFLQKKELQHNSQALRDQALEIQRTAEQAIIQSEKMAANELHARQETFLKIADSVRQQLGTISGLLYISSQGNTGDGTVDSSQSVALFEQQEATDNALFSRRLLQVSLVLEEAESYELFYGTAIRARHSNHFIFTFERMVRRAAELDTENMIRDALLASAHAFLYNVAKRHQANAPVELADHSRTGLHFNM
ncbi:MAG: hypothetical protein AB8B93_14780 [Pseudomonadales bacterium]